MKDVDYSQFPGLVISDELDESTISMLNTLDVPTDSAATDLYADNLHFEFAGVSFSVDPLDITNVIDALYFGLGEIAFEYDAVEAERILGTILSFVPDFMFNDQELFEALIENKCTTSLENICDRVKHWDEEKYRKLLITFGLTNLPSDFLKRKGRSALFRNAVFTYDSCFSSDSERRKFLSTFLSYKK